MFDENCGTGLAMIDMPADFSRNQRLLIGSYLTAEYSIESAALFNPSIVPGEKGVRTIYLLSKQRPGKMSSCLALYGLLPMV